MSSEYCAAAGRASAVGEPHRERYSFGIHKVPNLAQRWRTVVVTATWIVLGSLTMIVAPTTAGAQSQGLDVAVSSSSGSLKAGESIDYTFAVTNNSEVDVTSVVVKDSLGSEPKCQSDVIAVGASITCTGSYTITDADVKAGQVINTADVTASAAKACTSEELSAAPNGTAAAYTFPTGEAGWEWLVDYTDADDATVATIHTRVKSDDTSAAVASGLVGTDFTFQYGDSSTDEGNKPVQIEIDVANDAKVDAGTLVLDGRGATNLTSFTGDNNATGFTVATAGKASAPVLLAEDEASEVSADQTGADTAPDAGATLSADTRYYLGDTQIFADEAPAFSLQYGYDAMMGGESATFDFIKFGPGLDVENHEWSASLRGCRAEAMTLSASDTLTTPLAEAVPSGDASLKVVKNQPTGTFAVGQKLTWKIDVTNEATVAVKDLKLTDALTDDADESCPKTALDPKETMACTASYTVTKADVDKGQIDNAVTVAGVLPDGSAVTGKGEVSTKLAPPSNAAMTVKKVGVVVDANGDRQFQAGEVIKYSIVATNVGNVELTDIVIDDPLTDDEACPAKTLVVGKAMTCTATHIITATEISAGSLKNTATVTGTDPSGKKIVASGSAVNTLKNSSSLAVEKGHPSGNAVVGGTLKYPITVTNTGMLPLVDVEVSDSLVGTVTCDYQALSPGASAHCTATYVVKAQDATAGRVVNTVTVVAKDSVGAEVAAADFVSTTIAGVAATPTPVPTMAATPTPTASATATASPVPATPTPTPKTGLAVTGSNSGRPAMVALAMILLGFVLVGATHQRRSKSW